MPMPDDDRLVRLYRDEWVRYGPRIAAEGMGRRAIASEFGLSEDRSRTLARLVREYGPLPPGVEAEPTSAAAPELPEYDRWDQPARGRDLEGDLPHDEETVEELIERREAAFRRKAKAKRRLQTVRVRTRGPVGIVVFGDPHLDDDGCNWPLLRRWVEAVSTTRGMYAGQIGDITNNWVGRLGALYASQSSTFAEGLRLARWFLSSMPQAFAVWGNHDHWRDGATVLRLLTEGLDIHAQADHDLRLELQFPEGDPVRIHARHDFRGRSIYNKAHGQLRASMMDPWAHVYIAGHTHEWATYATEGPDGVVRHAVRVRGFKHLDTYADQGGYQHHEHGAAVALLIDPTAPPTERISLCWHPEEAASRLAALRARRGHG